MPLQGSGAMSFADVYNEMTGESLTNPPISITAAEQGQLQNSNGQTIPLNQYYTPRPDGNLPTVFPTEWYLYCQRCNQPTPYITIGKAAPTSVNLDTQFVYDIVLTNNGTSATSGTITVVDTLQANLQYLSSGGSPFNVTVNGQVVTATYTGVIPVNGQVSLYIYVKSTTQGTYYNYASVSGGGETITKTSNTTTTSIAQVTFTSSVTKRLVRTIQKNDCGEYGVGTFQEVYSPFFTATYTSSISQADADTNANNQATALCNQWLDANGQSVANQFGTCQYGYPQMTLSKSMPSNLNLNESGDVTIIMRNTVASTNGTITLSDFITYGFEFVSAINTPSPFTFSLNGRTVSYTTESSLPANYEASFVFRIRGVFIGSWENSANVQNVSILNGNATSNTVSCVITGNPTFSFGSGTENFSFNPGLSPKHAAPTDDVYYFATLTINNAPSTNTTIPRIDFILPANLTVINDVSVFYDTRYFSFSQGSNYNIAVFEQLNNVIVPIGQYGFYIRINLPIDYYRMSQYSTDEDARPNDDLILNSNGSIIFRRLSSVVNSYVNNIYQNSQYPEIIWSNNYTFAPNFVYCNGSSLTDKEGLTYSYSINYDNNFSEQFNISQINNQFFGNFIFVVNPTRDTYPGVVNPDYPHQKVIDNFFTPDEYQFGIFIFYKIYYYGVQTLLCNDDGIDRHETYINLTYNEPKVRPTTFRIRRNGAGQYLNLSGQPIVPEN
jgi:hypothetical protein